MNGTKDGKEVSYTFTKTGVRDMSDLTSTPAAAGAIQMLDGKVDQKGVIAPECLNPIGMIDTLVDIGHLCDDNDYYVEKKMDNEIISGSIRDKEKFPELYGKVLQEV